VSLGAGQSATVTIGAEGLSPGNTGAQFGVAHNNANTTITNAQCVGAFAGADANQATQADGTLLACTYGTGAANATSGDVMTITLTNVGGSPETISFNSAMTFYLTSALATEAPGSTTALTVTN
jgi:hypothetical protein